MESLAYLHTALAYESNEPAPELRDLSALLPSPTSAAWLSAQVLAVALVVGAAGSAMAATGIVQTNGNPLNVRSTPGGAIVSSLPNGARVELTGRRSGNYLELANGTWVSADWVSMSSTSPSQPPSGADRRVGFVNTAGGPLNVRNSPGGSVVGTLPDGTRVELTGRSSSGFLERSNGTWVDARYISYSQPPVTPPAPSPAPNPGTGAGSSTGFVRTNGSPLNVRNTPGGAVVGSIANGSRVELTGRSSSQWVERTDGTWVSNNWLVNDPSGNVGGDISFGRVRTNGSPLNVRNSPAGQVVGTLPNGSRVALTGRRSGNWVQLERFGAWASADWIVME